MLIRVRSKFNNIEFFLITNNLQKKDSTTVSNNNLRLPSIFPIISMFFSKTFGRSDKYISITRDREREREREKERIASYRFWTKKKKKKKRTDSVGMYMFSKTKAALLPTISINSPNCQKHLQSTRSRRREPRKRFHGLCAAN